MAEGSIERCGSGSSQLSGLEAASRALRLDALKALCKHCPLVGLMLVSDMAKSCSRLKVACGCIAAEHNESSTGGFILLIDVGCISHIIHRLVEFAFHTKSLVPKLHSMAFTASSTTNFLAMVRALRDIVAEDLQTNFFRHTEPAAEDLAAHKVIMDMTLLRVDTTRARNESESPFQGMSAALAEKFCAC